MFSGNFKKIFRLYRQHWRHTAKFFVLTTVHSAAFLYVPYLFRSANNVSKPDSPAPERYSLTRFTLTFFAGEDATLKKKYIIVFSTCGAYLVFLGVLSRWRIINNRVLEDLLAQDLRRQIVNSIRRRQRVSTAQLTQKAINDVNVITHSSTAALFSMLRGGVFFTGGLAALLAGFPQLAAISVPFVFTLTLNGYYYNEQLRQASAKQIASQGNIAAELGELNSYRTTVHTQRCEALIEPLFEQRLTENHTNAKRLASIRGRNLLFTEVFGVGYLLSLVAYASYLIASGQLQSENILLSLYAIYAAVGVRGINSGYSDLKEKIGVLNSLEQFLGEELLQSCPQPPPSPLCAFFELFENFFDKQIMHNAEEEFTDEGTLASGKEIEKFLQAQRKPSGMQLKGLWLRHGLEEEKDRQTATQQSIAFIEKLDILPGERLGIQGRSGLGKSTLFDFICGIGTPAAKGSVSFDVSQPNIFYFTQIPEVFARSFVLNIILGNVELLEFLRVQSGDETNRLCALFLMVRNLLKITNLWGVAQRSERLGRLNDLSPGEKQRLLFARLFFSNCDLILLDESVSNLDAGHYQRLLPHLQAFLDKRTCLVISHHEQFSGDICGNNLYPLSTAVFIA